MSLESFYGGRMGASFIIVKKFDGINIPQRSGAYVYKARYLAVTADEEYYIYDNSSSDNRKWHFIEKNEDNYKDYAWKLTTLNGGQVSIIDSSGDYSTQNLPSIRAEGMVQCFSQGGDTTNDVNYGEYVIIDTPDKRNPENGKVFRRGMNYDYNADTNPYAGGVYIGQIVGPQGATAEVGIGHYQDIIEDPEHREEIYDEVKNDLVSGSYIDNNNERQFNDDIKWAWVKLEDDYGNIIGCQIGFELPTLTLDFNAESVSAYYNGQLITEDPTQFIDGKWEHNFYQKWKVKIPKGIHGVNSTDIEVVHTKTKPKDYTTGYAGTPAYTDLACTNRYMTFTSSYSIMLDEEDIEYLPSASPIYNTDPAIISCRVNYTGTSTPLYVKKSDCYMDQLRYKETNFDQYEEGRITYHYFGEYDNLDDVELLSDGSLVLYFSAKEAPKTINEAITWINGLDLSQDGWFHVTYNNNKLDNGTTVQNKVYTTRIQWVDSIEMNDNGVVSFYYNTDPEHQYPHNFQLRFLNNVDIETIAEDAEYEGTGDQKVHVSYNTGETAIIGNPLNYIIETVISNKSLAFPDAPYSHLLVYYSDPALRQSMQDKWVRYPSQKYPGQIWDEWVDLGNVRGAAGGLHILIDVPNINELYDEDNQAIPPERLVDDQGQYIDSTAAGWAVTVTPVGAEISTIFCYDYEDKIWYSIGSIDIGAANPASVIVKSIPGSGTHEPDPADVSLLNEGGFWLASEQAYCAE